MSQDLQEASKFPDQPHVPTSILSLAFSLKTRLLVLLLGISVALACLAWTSYRGSNTLILRQADKGEALTNHSTVRSFQNWFRSIENLLAGTAPNLAFMIEDLGILPGTMGNYVRNLTEASEELGVCDIYLALPSGQFLDGNFWFPEGEFDPRETSWYKDAGNSNNLIFVPPHKDVKSDKTVISLVAPVFSLYQENRLLGVLGVDLPLEAFAPHLGGAGVGTGRQIMVIDGNGVILGHPELEMVGRGFLDVDGEFSSPVMKKIGDLIDSDLTKPVSASVSQGRMRLHVYPLRYGMKMAIVVNREMLLAPVARLGLHQGFAAGGAFLVILLLIISVSHSILLPVSRLVGVSQKAIKGDLTVRAALSGRDEISGVGAVFDQVLESQRTNLLRVSVQQSRLAAGSAALDSLAHMLAKASAELKNSSETLKADMQENLSHLDQAREGTLKVTDQASHSAILSREILAENRKLTEMSVAATVLTEKSAEDSRSIHEAFQRVTQAVQDLRFTAEGITGIVETIGVIAKQTNLLALNASIEAARAGAAGRGFAVVAEEVRVLAVQSSEAAEKVGHMARDVLAATGHVSRASDEGAELAFGSRERFQELARHFEVVLVSLKGIVEKVEKMDRSASEQAVESQRIAGFVDEVGNKAWHNLDRANRTEDKLEVLRNGVEQLTGASAELVDLLREQREMLYGYKLGMDQQPQTSGPEGHSVAEGPDFVFSRNDNREALSS